MFNVPLKIAVKFLFPQIQGTIGFVKRSSLLAKIALSLSIISLIIVNSLSNGYVYAFKDKVMSIDSHINIDKNDNSKISEKEVFEITSVLDAIDSIDEYYVEAYSKAILKDHNYY